MADVNGHRLISARIAEPRIGPWHASVKIDHDAAISGAALIDLDGVTWSGTILPGRSGVDGGHVSARIVGGAGGLHVELEAKAYVEAKASTVLADILREAGERLSPTVEASLLSGVLARWERSQGPALCALVSLLDKLGATYRVLRDGTIWVGTDTYPEATPGDYVLREEDFESGAILIQPERPSLLPGTTFLGQQLEEVVHRWSGNRLTSEAFTHSPRSSLERFVGGLRRAVDYSRSYPARVVQQNPDGTLQVVPDDDVVKGSGLDRVPIRYADPGHRTEVRAGDRVRLAFAAGDPSQPEVRSWETGSGKTKIGTLIVAQNAATFALLPPQFFPAGVVGDAEAQVAKLLILGAGNTAFDIAIESDVWDDT